MPFYISGLHPLLRPAGLGDAAVTLSVTAESAVRISCVRKITAGQVANKRECRA